MAKLNILPRKEFEIVLDGETVKGKFGTWAIKKLCLNRGLKLSEAGQVFSEINMLDVASLDLISDFILCAIENYSKLNKIPFSYSDAHFWDWVDQFGGLNSDAGSKFVTDLFKLSGPEEIEQKKTEVTADP